VLRRKVPLSEEVAASPGMSSPSAYCASSRCSESDEERDIPDSSNSLSSPVDSDCAVGAEEYAALHRPGYDWVDPRVKLPLSRFTRSAELAALRKRADIIADTVDERIVSVERVRRGDSVCHGREGHSHDFFYMYSTLVTDLHVCVPFDDFTMGVLRVLNVAPSQLHPNSWAALQSFRLICRVLHLKPSPQVFLQYYSTRPGELASWVSLVGQSHQCLLAAYTQSFKRFKTGFFKVIIRSAGAEYFYCDDGTPKFPFYWTNSPTTYRTWPRESLTPEDRHTLSYLDQLPKKLSSKKIIGVFRSSHPRDELFGMYVYLAECQGYDFNGG